MSERKYTDEQTIKALECCINADCLNCPQWSEEWYSGMCIDFLKSVLDLINRKNAEIEKLQEVNADLNESLRLAAEANKDLNAEIERLIRKSDIIRGAANSLKMHYEKAKAEVEEWKARAKERQGRVEKYLAEIERMEQESSFLAKRFYKEGVKDLAERLKANMCHGYPYIEIEEDLFRRDVDNLVAEMTEETK